MLLPLYVPASKLSLVTFFSNAFCLCCLTFSLCSFCSQSNLLCFTCLRRYTNFFGFSRFFCSSSLFYTACFFCSTTSSARFASAAIRAFHALPYEVVPVQLSVVSSLAASALRASATASKRACSPLYRSFSFPLLVLLLLLPNGPSFFLQFSFFLAFLRTTSLFCFSLRFRCASNRRLRASS